MRRLSSHLPHLVTAATVLLMLLHGPIAQPVHYHHFADARALFGLPNAADVLSNIGFALVGSWGLVRLWPARRDAAFIAGWPGYRLFLLALILTAAGSMFYHLSPDDLRLVWDRLPIALACAGLLAAVHGETAMSNTSSRNTVMLALAAVSSVGWWHVTGDLRPYLLMQGLPLVLIPLWQYTYRAPRADQLTFGFAIMLYITAKIAELYDQELLAMFGSISGHTFKHLLATAAATVITARLLQRRRNPG